MRISVTESGADLLDPADFTRFHVESALPAAQIDAALQAAGAGRVDNDHAFVSVAFLRSHAPAGDEQWGEGLQKMIAYAQSKGWVSADGEHLQAHIAAHAG
ncbi:hypothetical protein [Microbacterium sp. UCD-TDU]|uniref:hypothetical protein n=1 Tax=Microbacterium sp. UCD-TDU TaxID=1247714 RepID=UPI00034AB097|nr:hypothetical protein [Microbacterium sp. UCD-TDU]EYT57181.1 hypothetical protein D514_0118235 [Microbacterium sp. UCD-TDU]